LSGAPSICNRHHINVLSSTYAKRVLVIGHRRASDAIDVLLLGLQLQYFPLEDWGSVEGEPRMAGEDVILSARKLTKSFGGFTAVDGVDLDVRRGSTHALIGPNGAGKTTCFNLLSKFLQPSAGSIVFDGRDITRLGAADISRLGLVRSFQISAVFPRLTTIENVRVALQRRRGDSFDFWRSDRILSRYDEEAMARLDDVGLCAAPGGRAFIWEKACPRNRHDLGARTRDAAP
jgi:ABC-type glutathione transport system ATPase component